MPSIDHQVTVDLSNTIQNQHRDRLDHMQRALDALINLHRQPVSSNTASSLIPLVKQIAFLACTVPDSYFLSDACESVHDLFADFRILLGYFEAADRISQSKLEEGFADVVEDCSLLIRLYRSFLRDPGYSGTAFPKPAKIKAMRQMSRIMAVDQREMTQSSTNVFLKTPKPMGPATIVQMETNWSKQPKESFSGNWTKQSKESFNANWTKQPKESFTGKFNKTNLQPNHQNKQTDLLRVFKPPATPELKPQNLQLNAVLEAVKQLMPVPVPPPPRSNHEVSEPAPPKSALEEIQRNLLQTSLKPPTFVDDEGDELPHTPPPQISPVLSDSDSFMAAFRQYTKKQQERRASIQ